MQNTHFYYSMIFRCLCFCCRCWLAMSLTVSVTSNKKSFKLLSRAVVVFRENTLMIRVSNQVRTMRQYSQC